MEEITLDSFRLKWGKKIPQFIEILIKGQEVDIFSSEKSTTYFDKVRDESLDVENKSKDEITNSIIENNLEGKFQGVDKVKELSNDILQMDLSDAKPEDINLFSCREYGYDFRINTSNVEKTDLVEFFQEFSSISLSSFKLREGHSSLPESSYIRELFALSSVDKLKDYVFYLLMFKEDSDEYYVMAQFLIMCYLFKKISGSTTSSLNLLFKRIDVDYSRMMLILAMIFPKPGTII